MSEAAFMKALREFQKEPDNKRCADCKERGPQYLCLNFNTFVCTTCSGVHREFNFRVKGISMSTFTGPEVEAIVKHGGNAKARRPRSIRTPSARRYVGSMASPRAGPDVVDQRHQRSFG